MADDEYAIHAQAAGITWRQLFAIGAINGMAFIGILEICVLMVYRFRRRSGLYFWAMIAATIGALIYNLAPFLFTLAWNYPPSVINGLSHAGYMIYIPAEYCVLYSRLHLLSASRRALRCVLALMTAEYLLMAVPQSFLSIGGFAGWNGGKLARPASIGARVEVCVYGATEVCLSSTYIYHILRKWKSGQSEELRRVLRHMLYVNVFLILCYGINVTLVFTANSTIEYAFLGFIYVFQLKLEFWVLSRLTDISELAMKASHRLVGSGLETTGTMSSNGPETSQEVWSSSI